jgi:hypothetical protein
MSSPSRDHTPGKGPDRLERLVRLYSALLWFYPPSHRREYGALIVQAFRDHCRATLRSGRNISSTRLLLRALPDLIRSAFREQLTEQTQQMKSSPERISLFLFVAVVFAGLLSCNFALQQPAVALAFAYLIAPLLLARAYSDWRRSAGHLTVILVWAAALAVFFAVVFPVWAKVHLPVIPWIVLVPVLLNAAVPFARAIAKLATPRPQQ